MKDFRSVYAELKEFFPEVQQKAGEYLNIDLASIGVAIKLCSADGAYKKMPLRFRDSNILKKLTPFIFEYKLDSNGYYRCIVKDEEGFLQFILKHMNEQKQTAQQNPKNIKTKTNIEIKDERIELSIPKEIKSSKEELFADIINCRQCSGINNILCDDNFNLPQPGYVGKNYAQKGVLLVAQNPGDCQPGHKLFDQAQTYAKIIKQFSDDCDKKQFNLLNDFLSKFIPTWPLFNKIPLKEAGITINDIAYINLVHCRTFQNKSVPVKCATNCIDTHFRNTLTALKPSVVIFLGKWAYGLGSNILTEANIPHAYINRLRNLSSDDREENKNEVISLIKEFTKK